MAVLFFAGIAAILMYVEIAGRDIPPPDTSDLVLERTEVPAEQNAYTYFASATNLLYWPTNATAIVDWLDGKPVDEGSLRKFLDRNTNMVETIDQGVGRRIYQPPEVVSFETMLPHLMFLRNMGRVMAIQARHERLAEDYASAVQTCSELLKYGNLIQKDAGGLIEYLVGIAILDLGLTQAQDLAYDKGIPQEELARLSEMMAGLGPFDSGFIRSMKVEYRVSIAALEQIRLEKFGAKECDAFGFGDWKIVSMLRARGIRSYVFQPNRTKLLLAEPLRRGIRNAPRCYAAIGKMEQGKEDMPENGFFQMIARPNMIGNVLVELFSPSIDSAIERKCRKECTVVATRLLVVCNAFKKKEGKMPDSLQSLVPTYLASVPVDPYDGKPFRYSASKGIVYSVGKDLKDSGGSLKLMDGERECKGNGPAVSRWKTEDVVFEI